MDVTLLLDKLNAHYGKQFPFALYVLPQGDEVVSMFQKNTTLYTTDDFKGAGFIIAPFSFNGTAFYIPEMYSEVTKTPLMLDKAERYAASMPEVPSKKEEHLTLVEGALQKINSGKARKIVVSRKRDFKLKKMDIRKLFGRLMDLYPGAFRYLWYHPEHGLWCGATPEVLVKIQDDSFMTMALAGTQQYSEKGNHWAAKEIEEQQFVTDAITTSLQKITSVLKISKTQTYKAGSLAHLRTDITGILKNITTTLPKILMVLHPTPAICGTPRDEAKKFILEKEAYDRRFYTGFLGPVCLAEKSSQLFVNLRCMYIEDNLATLYVGGGITDASIPEEEWMETQNKMQTMLQVIAPML